MSKRKTQEEFEAQLKIINSNILVLGNYVNALTKIKVKCLIDGHEWNIKPNDLLNGHGCPRCKKYTLSNLKHKTHEEFIVNLNKLSNDIIILSDYEGCNKKIKCKCKLCNYEWNTTPTKLLSGSGCINCHRLKMYKTHDEFVNEVKIINSNIIMLEQYNGSDKKIKLKCKLDNHIWSTTPNRILNGQGCPLCALKSRSEKRRKCHEKFVTELSAINKNIKVLGTYKQNKIPILCECLIDNMQWYATPNNLLRGSRCPTCNESRGENRIRDFLLNNRISFEGQKKFDNLKGISGGTLSFDFFINESILVEYQGQFHDGTAYQQSREQYEIQKQNDRRKRQYAQDHGIELLEIWYWDYDNIEKILSDKLKI